MADEYMHKYSVRVFIDKETLNVTKEFWHSDEGRPSRGGAPAYQEFDPKTGKRTKATYYLNGSVHRNEKDGPAVQQWNPENDRLVYESYYEFGHKHRSGGKPAEISYDHKTGEVIEEKFYHQGEEYNPDTGKPLWIKPDEDWEPDLRSPS